MKNKEGIDQGEDMARLGLNREYVKRILNLAIPVVIEMVLGMVVWIVDTAMVGRLSGVALSAVGLGGQLFFSSVNIFAAIGTGATAIVSRHIGGKNYERGNESAAQALQIALVLGLIMFLCSYFFFDKLFILSDAEAEVISLGTDYLKIISPAALFMVPGFVASAILRASGDTKTPMIGSIIVNTINVVGDYVLIFGKWGFPKLGVAGAAIATALGQIVGYLYIIFCLFRASGMIRLNIRGLGKVNKKDFNQILRLSGPAFVNELMINGGRLIYSFMVIALGTVAFAANQIAVTAESLSYMPTIGFSVAATTLVGQSLGAGNKEEAQEYTRTAAFLGAAFMGLVAILFIAFPVPIVRFFNHEADIISVAALCIRIAALEQVPMALSMVLSGALKGAGDTKGNMYICLASNWLYRLPAAYLAVYVFKWPVSALWYMTAFQYVIETILFGIRFKKGKWAGIAIS